MKYRTAACFVAVWAIVAAACSSGSNSTARLETTIAALQTQVASAASPTGSSVAASGSSGAAETGIALTQLPGTGTPTIPIQPTATLLPPTPTQVPPTPTPPPSTPAARVAATVVQLLNPADLQVAESVGGSCWTGSLVSNLPSAWRCMTGNGILDPCYVVDGLASVVCPTDQPPSLAAIRIDLTEALGSGPAGTPGNPPGGTEEPVKVVLTDGTVCGIAAGATFGVDDMRANFACNGGASWLLGSPAVGNDGVWVWQAVNMQPGIGGAPVTGIPLQSVSVSEVWEE